MTRPRLVLFDCDGVIVDSGPTTDACLRANLTRHGVNLAGGALGEIGQAGTMAGVAKKLRGHGTLLPEDWLETFYEELYAALERGTPAIKGIKEVFDRLDHSGIPYAVCSNGRIRKMQIMLEPLGLWDRLRDRLYSAQELGAPKPSPAVYLRAARDWCTAPAECAVIEDSAIGARAAVAAGMRCFGYSGSGNTAELAPVADVVFQNMRDLPILLGLDPAR